MPSKPHHWLQSPDKKCVSENLLVTTETKNRSGKKKNLRN